MSNRIPVLLVYSKDAEPRMAQLPIIPRVGDELKSFGAPAHKVHRVVIYLDNGYPRIYLYPDNEKRG